MLYTTKIIYKIFIALAVSIAAVNFISCGDDAVNTIDVNVIPVIDSNVFEWSFIPVPAFNFYDNYIADTNEIYYIGDGNVFRCDGINSTKILTNFIEGEAICIDGLGNKTIYVGGSKRIGENVHPWVKKWNGSSFDDITLPQDSTQTILEICIESESSIWFAGYSGRIYRYDGNSVTPYFINYPNSYPTLFKKDNQVYFYVEGGTNYVINNIFKFNGSIWQLIISDTTNYGLNFSGLQLMTIGNNVLRKTPRFIEEFNTNNFTQLYYTATFEAYSVNGNDLNDFICYGIPDGTLYFFPYYFNGQKWLKQTGIRYPEFNYAGFPVDIKYCKGIYYGFYYAISEISHNNILVGRMKY